MQRNASTIGVGGELEQPNPPAPSPRNQIKHTVGGNDVTPLLSEPLLSLTAEKKKRLDVKTSLGLLDFYV